MNGRGAGESLPLGVNRSVTWADRDESLLSLELQDLNETDFDLSLTGYDPGKIDEPPPWPDAFAALPSRILYRCV
jgi:hypothetical protein